MSDETPQWGDVERLIADLRADGYDVDDIKTNTSEPTDDKLLMVAVSR